MALWWIRLAAEEGNPEAQCNLGRLYRHGEGGVPQCHSTAAEWFAKAAAQGRKDAQYFIGFMHYAGQGVDRDQSLAAEWFLKAAAQGQPDAQFNLGFQYEKGECVGKDEAMAVQWCKFC